MQEFQIEVNGKVQTVSLEQLRMLVSRRFIKPEAIARVGGEEFKVAEIIAQSSAGGKPNATGVPVSQTGLPTTGGATPDFGRVDVPSSQNTPPKKSRKVLVAGIIGLIVVVAVVAAILVVNSSGARKSKPSGKGQGTDADESATEQAESGNSAPGWEPFDRRWKIIPRSYSGSSCQSLFEEVLLRYAESEENVLEENLRRRRNTNRECRETRKRLNRG